VLGHLLVSESSRHAPDRVSVGETDWLIVTSHDCDIANSSLEKEPVVEVLRAWVSSPRPMTNSLTTAIVLAFICVSSSQCGRSRSQEPGQDTGTDQSAPGTDASAVDYGPDSPQPGPDGRDAGALSVSDALPLGADAGLADAAGGGEVPAAGEVMPDSGNDRRQDRDGTWDVVPFGGRDGASDVASDGPLVERWPEPLDGRGDLGSPESGPRCNDLLVQGLAHVVQGVVGTPPAPLGGIIEDGLYYETAAQIFSDTGNTTLVGETRTMAMLITGDIQQAVFTDNSSRGSSWQTNQMTFDVPDASPNSFTLKQLCPEAAKTSSVFYYSFVGSGPGATFTTIYPRVLPGGGTDTFVLTLTRQQ
jgi:hypothetical protein